LPRAGVWFVGLVGERGEISLTGFTGWSEVLSAREMSLLVLAVINIVYDMYVKVDTQAGICFEFYVRFSEIISFKRLIFFCFTASDCVLSYALTNVHRKYRPEIVENKLKGRWNTIL